jgi:phage host-nuclease inhibitor protein Gam
MNRSFSKIRHIQEANQRLEKRLMNEQVQQTGSTTPNTAQSFEELKKSLVGKKIQLYTDTTKAQWPEGGTNNYAPLFVVEIQGLSQNPDSRIGGIDFIVKDLRGIDSYGERESTSPYTQTKDIYLSEIDKLNMRCGSDGEFRYGKRKGVSDFDGVPFSNEIDSGKTGTQSVYVMSKNLATELNKSNYCKSKFVDRTPDMQP